MLRQTFAYGAGIGKKVFYVDRHVCVHVYIYMYIYTSLYIYVCIYIYHLPVLPFSVCMGPRLILWISTNSDLD